MYACTVHFSSLARLLARSAIAYSSSHRLLLSFHSFHTIPAEGTQRHCRHFEGERPPSETPPHSAPTAMKVLRHSADLCCVPRLWTSEGGHSQAPVCRPSHFSSAVRSFFHVVSLQPPTASCLLLCRALASTIISYRCRPLLLRNPPRT